MPLSKRELSRRKLLSGSGALGSALVFGASSGDARKIAGKVPWEPGEANAPEPVQSGPYQFLSKDEVAFLDSVVARLIPKDELGPGAKEAGVTTFIDRQLAGQYGKAASWYMQGPWSHGTDSQGYQSRLTPAQVYRAAIKSADDHCRQAFQGKRFALSRPTIRIAFSKISRTARSNCTVPMRRRSSPCFYRIRSRASFQTPSTAAIATWPAGS